MLLCLQIPLYTDQLLDGWHAEHSWALVSPPAAAISLPYPKIQTATIHHMLYVKVQFVNKKEI